MKINFIVPEISRTGGMNIIFQYANRLKKHGHDVEMYSSIVPLNMHKNNIKWYYLKYQVKSFLKWLKLGRAIIPENMYPYCFKINFVPMMLNMFVRNADVLIATSWPTAFPVYHFSSSKGRKYYLIQDYEAWNSNIKMVDRSYTLPLKRIVCSKYMQNLLKSKFGSESELIYIGLDRERFNADNKTYNDPPVITFQDHSLPNKNIEQAIYTVEKLKSEYPELRFKSFGIQQYHKMPEYVEFTTNPDDKTLTNIYSTSDIFLFSSKYEGFGSPPSEAMACKCCIVANKVAAIPEYSEHMKTGIHADPNDPDGLYKGVKLLLENKELIPKISEAAFKHIRKFMDWDKSVNKFAEFISK